jgi:hypothetical protein
VIFTSMATRITAKALAATRRRAAERPLEGAAR